MHPHVIFFHVRSNLSLATKLSLLFCHTHAHSYKRAIGVEAEVRVYAKHLADMSVAERLKAMENFTGRTRYVCDFFFVYMWFYFLGMVMDVSIVYKATNSGIHSVYVCIIGNRSSKSVLTLFNLHILLTGKCW